MSQHAPDEVDAIQVDLGPVQETLLIPLLGRARESTRDRALLRDPKAARIVAALDYDFSKWEGTATLRGACLRTVMYDRRVQAFLDAHPDGTVVEIGAGLNTRYERLDNGRARWVELDLPDSMALRRRFFQDTARRTLIAGSVLDAGWLDEVAARPGPYLFVSEAVLIYLEAPEVERAIRSIARRFHGATLLMALTSSRMVDRQHHHDAMRHLPRESWFRWRCDDATTLGSWGLRLVHEETFANLPREAVAASPFLWKWMARLAPWLVRRLTRDYRIGTFELVLPR